MNFLPTVQKPLNDENILSDDETDTNEDFMPEPVMKPKPVPEDIFETTEKEDIDCENVEQSEEEEEEEPEPPKIQVVRDDEPKAEQVIKKPRVKAEVHEEGYKETGYVVIMCKNGKKRWMRENYKEVQGARMKNNILLHRPKRGKNKPNPIVQKST